jgi:hypothetical protein
MTLTFSSFLTLYTMATSAKALMMIKRSTNSPKPHRTDNFKLKIDAITKSLIF